MYWAISSDDEISVIEAGNIEKAINIYKERNVIGYGFSIHPVSNLIMENYEYHYEEREGVSFVYCKSSLVEAKLFAINILKELTEFPGTGICIDAVLDMIKTLENEIKYK